VDSELFDPLTAMCHRLLLYHSFSLSSTFKYHFNIILCKDLLMGYLSMFSYWISWCVNVIIQ